MAIVCRKISFSLVFVILSIGCTESYDNEYDRHLDYGCSGTYGAISYIRSVHHNGFEDRRFSLNCRNVPLLQARNPSSSQRRCSYSVNWENEHDQLLSFHCSPNYYIVGMESRHDDRTEDRKWKFNCCFFRGYYLHGCSLTSWTNDLDGEQTLRVPTGKVIAGVISFHQNAFEDRRYRYIICSVGYNY